MKRIIKYIFTNKTVRFVGVVALIAGLVFVIWSAIPLNPVQKELDIVLNDPGLVVEDKPNYIILKSKDSNAKSGLIFYPGAKIDSRAYLYKLAPLVSQGKLNIFISKPFLHYAFTDISAGDKIVSENKEIAKWGISGHSLGGAMACKYTKDSKNMDFLILFGSYCADDISVSNIKVLSVVGSEDGLLGSSKIDKYKLNFPKAAQFEIIEGMNHAQIGNYGDQFGDKHAISPDEFTRLRLTNTIKNFLNS
jgi:hypothetical protein